MSQSRNTAADTAPLGRPAGYRPGARLFTARSVVASTLLGVEPPLLSSRVLVRAGELFGIPEGTTRVALSRMASAGELVAEDGRYRLAGPLLERQARQTEGRRAERRSWDGTWQLWVVVADSRTADERAELRSAMRALRVAELREGTWLRPDNLVPDRQPEAARVVITQCRNFSSRPHGGAGDLARSLWDLDAWSAQAETLRGDMRGLRSSLDDGDTSMLAPAFELSAAVLRHLVADPLLPDELLPAGWQGDDLRLDYDEYDTAFKSLWRTALL
jgi:phenylacetic acid degradation operon negative regulatory protein